MNTRADAVVLFGVTGDLVFKKLIPALYELTLKERLGVPVVGVARSAWDDARLHETVRKSVEQNGPGIDEAAQLKLTGDLSMVTGDYANPDTYRQLADRLAGTSRPVFYLAVPPSVFSDVVDGLAAVGLA